MRWGIWMVMGVFLAGCLEPGTPTAPGGTHCLWGRGVASPVGGTAYFDANHSAPVLIWVSTGPGEGVYETPGPPAAALTMWGRIQDSSVGAPYVNVTRLEFFNRSGSEPWSRDQYAFGVLEFTGPYPELQNPFNAALGIGFNSSGFERPGCNSGGAFGKKFDAATGVDERPVPGTGVEVSIVVFDPDGVPYYETSSPSKIFIHKAGQPGMPARYRDGGFVEAPAWVEEALKEMAAGSSIVRNVTEEQAFPSELEAPFRDRGAVYALTLERLVDVPCLVPSNPSALCDM